MNLIIDFDYFRPSDQLIKLAEEAFGSNPETTKNLSLYKDLIAYDEEELANLLQLRVACFATSTWRSHSSSIKRYIIFCQTREVALYPVDTSILDLCILHLVQLQKSVQVIENLVKAVIFASNFLGCSLSMSNCHIKNTLKFVSKICNSPNKQKDGLESKDIRKLWDKIELNGGIKQLSLAEIRTFVMAVFSHHTLCRFSCASG